MPKSKLWIASVLALSLLLTFGYAGAQDLTVTVLGPFSTDAEILGFEDSIAKFEAETGIDVIYEGRNDFDAVLSERVGTDNAPDVGVLPQPGRMNQLAQAGAIVPLWSEILDIIEQNYAPIWLQLGSYQGEPYGVFYRVNVKSLVFYPRQPFEAAGYEIPQTWDALIELSDQIVADGGTPWCIGMESGTATGWVGTDWMEDILLRTAGGDVYDTWVNHEIPFDDPSVVRAAEIMGDIWFKPGYVLGGTESILTTSFDAAPLPMFDETPGCWLHRQGNFVTAFFPDFVREDLDTYVGVFPLPPIDEAFGLPALGGGDQFVMFNDRPEVRAFMEFIATPSSTIEWAASGGALFPHRGQDLSVYPDDIRRDAIRVLLNADTFRFDASDLMPQQVGAGTFWAAMVEYVESADIQKAQEILATVEASYP